MPTQASQSNIRKSGRTESIVARFDAFNFHSLPVFTPRGKVQVANTEAGLIRMAARLGSAKEIGLDTETFGLKNPDGTQLEEIDTRLALVQTSAPPPEAYRLLDAPGSINWFVEELMKLPGENWIADFFVLKGVVEANRGIGAKVLLPLAPIFEDPGVVIAGHNLSFEKAQLAKDNISLKLELPRFHDTKLQVRHYFPFADSTSLQRTVELLFGLTVDKTLQTADWSVRSTETKELDEPRKLYAGGDGELAWKVDFAFQRIDREALAPIAELLKGTDVSGLIKAAVAVNREREELMRASGLERVTGEISGYIDAVKVKLKKIAIARYFHGNCERVDIISEGGSIVASPVGAERIMPEVLRRLHPQVAAIIEAQISRKSAQFGREAAELKLVEAKTDSFFVNDLPEDPETLLRLGRELGHKLVGAYFKSGKILELAVLERRFEFLKDAAESASIAAARRSKRKTFVEDGGRISVRKGRATKPGFSKASVESAFRELGFRKGQIEDLLKPMVERMPTPKDKDPRVTIRFKPGAGENITGSETAPP